MWKLGAGISRVKKAGQVFKCNFEVIDKPEHVNLAHGASKYGTLIEALCAQPEDKALKVEIPRDMTVETLTRRLIAHVSERKTIYGFRLGFIPAGDTHVIIYRKPLKETEVKP